MVLFSGVIGHRRRFRPADVRPIVQLLGAVHIQQYRILYYGGFVRTRASTINTHTRVYIDVQRVYLTDMD